MLCPGKEGLGMVWDHALPRTARWSSGQRSQLPRPGPEGLLQEVGTWNPGRSRAKARLARLTHRPGSGFVSKGGAGTREGET